ncbi:MAG: hypothetical protein WA702_00515 [Bradyrhizobium sp.]|uniref:hypothetical protein n=1 Tax=Bradyrhizobium sp. TaxID=376 RepID=UPI003C7A8313
MSTNDAREYRRQKMEELHAAIRESKDAPLLELLGKIRPYTHSAYLGNTPRAVALYHLQLAIDEVAEAFTADREDFSTGSPQYTVSFA